MRFAPLSSQMPLLALLALLAATPGSAGATPGDLDTTFDGDGIALPAIPTVSLLHTVVLQPVDGKILVGGVADSGPDDDFFLARLTATGSLDPTFGTGGVVITQPGTDDDIVRELVVQSDGMIVAAGAVEDGNDFDVAVARYDTNGVLDPGFGLGGLVVTSVGADDDFAMGVVLQSDGKIVVAGSVRETVSTNDFDLIVLRYETDGTLDPTFDGDGIVVITLPYTQRSSGVALDPRTGQIVVAGTGFEGPSAFTPSDIIVARLDDDGSLDATFGNRPASPGIAFIDLNDPVDPAFVGPYDEGNAVAVRSDGKIYVAGSTRGTSVLDLDFAVARLDVDGNLDPSFGLGGFVHTALGPNPDAATELALVGEKVIIAGYVEQPTAGPGARDQVVIQYTDAGVPDSSVGPNGRPDSVAVDDNEDEARGLAVQPNGRIIVSGTVGEEFPYQVRLVRYQGASPVCGNGVVEAGEGCDVAAGASGPCCTAACALATTATVCRPEGAGTEALCDEEETCTSGDLHGACAADDYHCVDNFKCYQVKPLPGAPAFAPRTVTLSDEFETKSTVVAKLESVCNVVDELDDDEPDDPTARLACYKIKAVSGQPKLAPQSVHLESRFGSLQLTAKSASSFCIPTSFDVDPASAELDRFKCYKAGITSQTPKFVKQQFVFIGDEFEEQLADVTGVATLCNPAHENASPLVHPSARLTCLKIKDSSDPLDPGSDPFIQEDFDTTNAYETTMLRAKKPTSLCVRSRH